MKNMIIIWIMSVCGAILGIAETILMNQSLLIIGGLLVAAFFASNFCVYLIFRSPKVKTASKKTT